MIKTTQSNVAGPMDKAEAQAIPDRIRGHIDAAWKDLVRARDGQAWKALGYPTWEAYVKKEFGISDRHSRRLLDQGEVIAAIEDATGPMGPLSERAARELKDDLPAAVEQIKARAETGENPADAAKDIASTRREEKAKAKAAKQAEFDRQREEAKAALPDGVKEQKPAPADDDHDALLAELEEARETIAALEKDVARLTAENQKYAEMKALFDKGGFEAVLAAKDEVITVQKTRIERESGDKVSWKRNADLWRKRAEEAGWSNDVTIDLETGEVIDA